MAFAMPFFGDHEADICDEDEVDNLDSDLSLEEIQLNKRTCVNVPLGLCENAEVVDHFFSMDTWNCLEDGLKARLMAKLPQFSSDLTEDAEEKKKTLQMLFNGGNFHFGNQLTVFKKKLATGQLNPDAARKEYLLRQIEHRSYEERLRERSYTLLQDVLTARKKLLESQSGEPARTPLSVLRMERKSVRTATDLESRVRSRYLRELSMMRNEVGEEGDSSEDELEKDGPGEIKRRKREINLLDSDYWKSFNDQPAPRAPSEGRKPRQKQESLLLKSKAAKQQQQQQQQQAAAAAAAASSLPNPVELSYKPFNTSAPDLSQLRPLPPTQYIHKSQEQRLPSPQKKPFSVNDVSVVEEAVANIPMSPTRDQSAEMALNELDNIMNPTLPRKREDVLSPAEETATSCYFCLLRDTFQGSPDSKITIPALQNAVQHWQESASASRCGWLTWVPSWKDQIPSAVAFLSGAFPDCQPHEFSAFIDCDPTTGAYRWIGRGRDSDAQMTALTRWWLDRRDRCKAVTTIAGQQQQPKPTQRQETLSAEERVAFQSQERDRFSKPHLPFAYHVRGRSVAVAPVRAVPLLAAAGAQFLVADRPQAVSFEALVRDAVARLPNGEGSRTDVAEMLKGSQYLVPNSFADGGLALATAVAAALDRLQGEADACVRFDAARNNWINLHQNRTQADFAQRQQQATSASKGKPRKKSVADPSAPLQKRQQPSSSATTTATAPPSQTQTQPQPQTVQVITSQGVRTLRLSMPMTSVVSPGASLLTAKPGTGTAQQSMLRLPTKPILPKSSIPAEKTTATSIKQPHLPHPGEVRPVQRVLMRNATAPVVRLGSPQLQVASPVAPHNSAAHASPIMLANQQPQVVTYIGGQQGNQVIQLAPGAVQPQTDVRYVSVNAAGPNVGNVVRLMTSGSAAPTLTPVRIVHASPRPASVQPAVRAATPQNPSTAGIRVLTQGGPGGSGGPVAQRIVVGGKHYSISTNSAGQHVLTPLPQQNLQE